MSTVNNPWVGYLQRSYLTVKNSLLSGITTSNPELTDHSESNVFIIIIDMVSGIAEMLNYYVDNVAREGFMATAQRRSSVIKHSFLLDYRIKLRNNESVNVTITTKLNGVESSLTQNVNIPAGTTIISNTDSYAYRTLEDFTMTAGASVFNVPFAQVDIVNNVNLGTTDGTRNQRISLPSNIVNGTLELTIGTDMYEEVNTWAEQNFDDNSYIIVVNPDNSIEVELGDNARGSIPSTALVITASYYTTVGPEGRIQPNELTTAPSPALGLPSGFSVSVTNHLASSGGAFLEATEDIRNNAVYGKRSNDRMVGRADYKKLTEAIPGVSKALVASCCSKNLELYIVPTGGGIASNTLVSQVESVVDNKKIFGRTVDVIASGQTIIFIQATVTAKQNRLTIDTQSDVQDALIEYGRELNQEINRAVRISDITTLVDSLDRVEFVDIDIIYAIPFVKPDNHVNSFQWRNQVVKEGFTQSLEYRITHNNGNLRVVRDRLFVGNFQLGSVFEDDFISFEIDTTSYSNGNVWTFTVYPRDRNINIDDYTIPTTNLSNLNITVVPLTDENQC